MRERLARLEFLPRGAGAWSIGTRYVEASLRPAGIRSAWVRPRPPARNPGGALQLAVVAPRAFVYLRGLVHFCGPAQVPIASGWDCVVRELKRAAHLIHLPQRTLTADWSPIVHCFDASWLGFGLVEKHARVDVVRDTRRRCERWRCSRSQEDEWRRGSSDRLPPIRKTKTV